VLGGLHLGEAKYQWQSGIHSRLDIHCIVIMDWPSVFILFYFFLSIFLIAFSLCFPSFSLEKNQLQLEAQFSSFLLALFGCLIELSVHF